jgi:murein DD-endopeptidase MepM/ murein hydrolase activator NlpD
VATAVSLWVQDWFDGEDSEKEPVAKPTDRMNASFVTMKIDVEEKMVLPIEEQAGRVTSVFGERKNPTAAGEEFHKGLDIAAVRGTPIAAMQFGVVTDAGEDSKLGRYLVVSHGELEILYAHCDTVTARIGDVVQAGDTVATVGSTGNSTGNHLHVEMVRSGDYVNPAEWITVAAYD